VKKTGLTVEGAESVAAQALHFLSLEPDRLERFMSLSGFSIDALRQASDDRSTLEGILDYVLNDEALVLGLAEFADIDPTVPAVARAVLDGSAHHDDGAR